MKCHSITQCLDAKSYTISSYAFPEDDSKAKACLFFFSVDCVDPFITEHCLNCTLCDTRNKQVAAFLEYKTLDDELSPHLMAGQKS